MFSGHWGLESRINRDLPPPMRAPQRLIRRREARAGEFSSGTRVFGMGGCLQRRVVRVWELGGALRHADAVVKAFQSKCKSEACVPARIVTFSESQATDQGGGRKSGRKRTTTRGDVRFNRVCPTIAGLG